MARYSKNHVPTYRFHKKTGNAVVTIGGKDTYLGPYSEDEAAPSKQAYNQLIAKWYAAGRNAVALATQQAAAAAVEVVNVEEIIAGFWSHAQVYYRGKDGPSGELVNFAVTLRLLRRLYGKTEAAKFDSECLEACQMQMIRDGLARNTINRRSSRIRQVFKWAVKKKLVPGAVLESLRAVDGLKLGRTEAKETAPVKAVAEAHARAAIKHASRHIAAMIELQWLTGMRSGEMVIMRTIDIDRSADVWTYTPTRHKTQHHGHERIVYLGKRAQEIVTPFLKMDLSAFIFSPADADAERRAALSAARQTPRSCGNRPGTNRKTAPLRTPGARYAPNSYAFAVYKACDRAFPPPAPLARRTDETIAEYNTRLTPDQKAALKAWTNEHRFHPHQLRHAAGKRIRRDFGIDTQRAVLGQKTVEAAEVYGELDMTKARDVMAKIG